MQDLKITSCKCSIRKCYIYIRQYKNPIDIVVRLNDKFYKSNSNNSNFIKVQTLWYVYPVKQQINLVLSTSDINN